MFLSKRKKPLIVGAVLLVLIFGAFDYRFNIAIFRYIFTRDELTVTEIKTISNSIGSVVCPGITTNGQYEGAVAGSGAYLSLQTNKKKLNLVITNEHVAQFHAKRNEKVENGSVDSYMDEYRNENRCGVEFSLDGEILPYGSPTQNRIGFHYNENSVRKGEIVDLALLSSDVIEDVNKYLSADEKNKGITKESLIKAQESHLLDTGQYGFCKVKNPIGMKVYIFGYPSSSETGTTNVQSVLSIPPTRHLTVTQGIISGKEQNNFFTTALIDTGSSGGLAVIKYRNKPCILGIPTLGTIGDLTTMGIIQPFTNVYSAGFDWEKIGT